MIFEIFSIYYIQTTTHIQTHLEKKKKNHIFFVDDLRIAMFDYRSHRVGRKHLDMLRQDRVRVMYKKVKKYKMDKLNS
jgi:hypothetical protein